MKEIEGTPFEGQWVEVWEYNNLLWCSTYCWIDGKKMLYSEESDI